MFKKKVSVPTFEEKLGTAQADVAQALNVFEQAKQKVIVANANLDKVATEVDAELHRLATLRASITDKQFKNNALITKLDEFTVE